MEERSRHFVYNIVRPWLRLNLVVELQWKTCNVQWDCVLLFESSQNTAVAEVFILFVVLRSGSVYLRKYIAEL